MLYASTMKCPSKQVVDQLNVMQRGFIWNNKKPKIKHSTSVADYSEGGYKDIDIRTKLTALKVASVTKLLDDNFHLWKIIPTILFATFGGIKNIFHHNFKASKQCRSKVNKLPKFYQELIQLWSKVGGKKCSNASEICGEVLWNNAWIVSNGETLYNKHFVDNGILTVKNIIDESGRPLSWAEVKQKYNLNNSHVFNWFGLIKSIPRNWKNILCTNPDRSTADIQNQINKFKPLYNFQSCLPNAIETISKTSNSAKVIGKNARTGKCRLEQDISAPTSNHD